LVEIRSDRFVEAAAVRAFEDVPARQAFGYDPFPAARLLCEPDVVAGHDLEATSAQFALDAGCVLIRPHDDAPAIGFDHTACLAGPDVRPRIS
jgi:hypothetical protein